MAAKRGLLERLQNGEYVICAEGYLFEFERRGYLKAGAFVPEIVIEHPHLVQNLHEEFVHCGSDVVVAFTFYGHREKLKLVGREHELESFNRNALRIARKVADSTGTLMAGNLCNTTIFTPGKPDVEEQCRQMFKEQIRWAVEEKADFILAETYYDFAEAKFALQCIKEFAPGMPSVVTLAPNNTDTTYDGVRYSDALEQLENLWADVVGLNCWRGPNTMITLMQEVRQKCKGPIGCLPTPYRTSDDAKCMQDLRDQNTGEKSFPVDLDSWLCSRSHIVNFTKQLKETGAQFVGLCCGNRAHYIRAMAETLGKHPMASKYSTDMSQHVSQVKGDEFQFTQQGWKKTFG